MTAYRPSDQATSALSIAQEADQLGRGDLSREGRLLRNLGVEGRTVYVRVARAMQDERGQDA